MSSPRDFSVNDGVDPDQFSLQCIKLDNVVTMVSRFGSGALIAKFDIEHAFRHVAVHPSQRFSLGMRWREKFYVGLALPFGSRPAPLFLPLSLT